ncbi:hypothetical protein H4R18_001303 [Coemansia javaensis]|uniref:Uncharacterized protein n=1 Tax=Coemansia javaensis TaxID=2761396 RepID=A0A9W8HIM0_9FUNG|nr:hypothetical protein H4R18_001303 [Coemansia javaensis]
MAIWRQGGFFQELAEREQHLQWFPKAYVPAEKVGDNDFVVKITCCTCGTCVCCLEKKKKEEAAKPKEPPKEPPKCTCDKKPVHCHCHCCCC